MRLQIRREYCHVILLLVQLAHLTAQRSFIRTTSSISLVQMDPVTTQHMESGYGIRWPKEAAGEI